MKSMNEQYNVLKKAVDDALAEYFRAEDDGLQGLREAMRYSLLAGGKRIRPVLCLEFARLGGLPVEKALPVACGVEMLHTYSLIHDDLPCMDDDDERRGKPSNHRMFGETEALLAGDCLQAEAFAAVCSAEIGEAERFRCCRILAKAAGLSGICGGQHLDLLGSTQTVDALTVAEYGKTATLMGASCALGAAAAGGDESAIARADRFGTMLGMAFQCRDDLLDRDGFCALVGEEKCNEMLRRYTQEALDQLDTVPDASFLRLLTEELSARLS